MAAVSTGLRAQTAPAFSSAGGRTPLDWANDLVTHVALSETTYAHTTAEVTWAGQHGATTYVSHADCSSFFEALLTQTYGVTPEQFRAWLGKRRPYAKDFFDAIQAENGFSRLAAITQVHPGDVFAVRYVNSAPGDNTGHIMLVGGAPERRTATKPVVANTQQWDVPVIDSSETGHGKTDTRHLPSGKLNGGVGRGSLRIYADHAGTIVGYAWSDYLDSTYYAEIDRPIVVGRLKTSGAPAGVAPF
jgi:hypothetical protein